jgi:ATP-dependent DNA helicase RecG
MKILSFCIEAKSRKEVLEYIGVSSQTKNYERYLEPLISKSLIELTLPDKPKSKNQQYITSVKGKQMIQSKEKKNLK